MLRNKIKKTVVVFAAVMIVAVVAKAGGPLYIFDAAAKKPYWWRTTQQVKVYTDVGPFEVLPEDAPPETVEVTNAKADSVVAFAIGQWSNVSTSSFRARVAGDFASVGLGDVKDGPSAETVLNTDNGGGIHFVYDADGQVMEQYFGIPAWAGVLGIASPEWANEETGEITEAWVVINSTQRFYTDNDLEQYAAVFTHEFGHSINLAYSQVNGSIFFSWTGGAAGPKNCDTPYEFRNEARDVETMHPFIDPYAYPDFGNPSGKEQSTVDIADDKVALSNLYPSSAYAASTGKITGKVTLGNGNHNGITGLNVIAGQNLDNPYADAISAMSGDYIRPENGGDGTFTIRGLRHGARYVLYFNAIAGGGYPTMQPYHIPSPEEFYNGNSESDNGRTDSPCEYSTITASRGNTKTANIELNQVKGAPTFLPIGPGLIPTSITSDGKTIGGSAGGLVFKWSERDGAVAVGGDENIYGSTGSMSRDGRAFSGDSPNSAGQSQATLYKENRAPLQLPAPAGAEPCDALTNNYGVAAYGKAVAGMTWWAGCSVRAFIWTPQRGSRVLPVPDGTNNARPNNMSDDGSTVVGWFDNQIDYQRQAAIWRNGQFRSLGTPQMFVGEAYNTTPDGKTVVGADAGTYNSETGYIEDTQAWYWNQHRGLVRLGRLQPEDTVGALAINDDGSVIAGLGGADMPIFFGGWRSAFIWTERLGMVDFEHFLQSQGTFLDGWMMNAPLAMSEDGTEITGYGFGPRASGGWLVKMDKVNMCHAGHWDPRNTTTINVPFPNAMNAHLEHGDTIGVCSNGR